MESPLTAWKTRLTSRRARPQSSSADANSNGDQGNDCLDSPAMDKLAPNLVEQTSSLPENPMNIDSTAFQKEHQDAPSCLPEDKRRFVQQKCTEVQQRVPLAKKAMYLINLCPPRLRMFLLYLWLLWKVVLALLFLHMVLFTTASLSSPSRSGDTTQRFAREIDSGGSRSYSGIAGQTHVLFIVTTLAEFNNGLRATERGQDRLGEVLIPILVDSVESMVHEPFNYAVDVYFISAFPLKVEREEYIRERLPDGVGLEIWDDACPLGYEAKHSPDKVIDNTRALARQHRYVIKDKLPYYDLFVAFEDDMRVTGDHVFHFLKMSEQIEQLRLDAPQTVPGQVPENMDPKSMRFYGPMTQGQLDRIIPGFIRVEVLLNEEENGAQKQLDNIEPDFTFEVSQKDGAKPKQRHFNPRICCHVHMMPNKGTPVHPKPMDVVIWETNIKAMSVRKMPKPEVGKASTIMDWVAVLPGPGKRLDEKFMVGGYWSGRDGAFGNEEKPSGGRPDIIAQQGGWMATRSQILRMNNELCMGRFVPPFDEPMYKKDGQESFNVEFWSGGYQFFTGVRGGCNMQRIVSLHPDHFSSHFIYHVANNKQRQLNQARMVRADNFFAQLNTVRKTAEKALPKKS